VGQPVVDLGVLNGRRYVTLPALRADGERALCLNRWDAQLDALAETMLGLRTCRVRAGHREQVETIAVVLVTVRIGFPSLSDAVGAST